MTPGSVPSMVLWLMFSACVSAATFHVSPTGDDAAAGSADAPWRTIAHALDQLQPGDTLLLRAGRYRERVRCALVGTAEKPIVIRGEHVDSVIIDGGIAEFFDDPAGAWEPVNNDGLYQSARTYRNVTDVAGAFGDEPIALATYYLRDDLVSTNERAGFDADTRVMDRNVYVGPGLWLDRASGRILARLAPTHNRSPLVRDYDGQTDPRKLALVIAAEGATPLTLDGAEHVRVESLTLVGGAPDAVVVRDSGHVTLDRLVVRHGGFRGQTSGHVRVTNSQFIGAIPPWVWRADASTGCASGHMRDIVRVWSPILFDTSHEVMVRGVPRQVIGDDAVGVPQMVRPPANHDWEIAHCEFTDGHDGVYPVGRRMRMRHCVIDNMQDDAVDFSSPVGGLLEEVVFERNLIRRCVTAVSTHNQGRPTGTVYVTGNVIDLRWPMAWIRPTDDKPEGRGHRGNVFFMHGSDRAERIESYFVYHNTVLGFLFHPSFYAHGFLSHHKPGATRRVFNNLFVYLNAYLPPYLSKSLEGMDVHADHNLHWSVVSGDATPANYLERWRSSPYSLAREAENGGLWEEHSFVSDPMFASFDASPEAVNDYRPLAHSRAVGAARELPSAWPGRRSRTIGALDAGDEPLRVGVEGRIVAGEPWTWNH